MLSLLAFGLAGLSVSASLAGSLLLAAVLWAVSFSDPFAAIHLLRRGTVLAMLGLLVVGVMKLFAPRLSPWFTSLIYVALLVKGFRDLSPQLLLHRPSDSPDPLRAGFTIEAYSIFGADSPSIRWSTI